MYYLYVLRPENPNNWQCVTSGYIPSPGPAAARDSLMAFKDIDNATLDPTQPLPVYQLRWFGGMKQPPPLTIPNCCSGTYFRPAVNLP